MLTSHKWQTLNAERRGLQQAMKQSNRAARFRTNERTGEWQRPGSVGRASQCSAITEEVITAGKFKKKNGAIRHRFVFVTSNNSMD